MNKIWLYLLVVFSSTVIWSLIALYAFFQI